MSDLYDVIRNALASGIEESIAASLVTNVPTQIMTNGKPVSGHVSYKLGTSKGFTFSIDNFNMNCILLDGKSVDKNAHDKVVRKLYANKVKDDLLLAYLNYLILSVAKTRLPASRALIHFSYALQPVFKLDGFSITGCGLKGHPVEVQPDLITALIKHGLNSVSYYPKVKSDDHLDENGVDVFDL